VFDMGESVRILDLAEKMIRLSGFEPGKDIQIKITGLRPGEKLYEEVLSDAENTMPTHHPQILIARVRTYNRVEVEQNVEALTQLFNTQDNKRIVSELKALVPEFISNNSVYSELDK
jgi:FlaA1/EpsC-like NDP-sugar epimerase